MILFRNLSVKQVLEMTEQDLRHENTKTLSNLRKWIGEQMLKISTVMEGFEGDVDTTKLLKQQKDKLAEKRVLVDKIKNEY